jgi:hypothetical protein
VQNRILSGAWVLLRVLVEHAVNSLYLMYVGDDQSVEDFVDYASYKVFREFEDLKSTSEMAYQNLNSTQIEPEIREHFEQIRSRFDGNRGDKWCVDDRLYKRAAKLDKIITDNFVNNKRIPHLPLYLHMVNSTWRFGSAFVHGTAEVLMSEIVVRDSRVGLQQASTEELAQLLRSANLNLLLLLMHMDAKMGPKYSKEIVISLCDILER